jgi:2-hydroxy-3-keto-5-methylthiopentenyl-1-phosphate phosphatase
MPDSSSPVFSPRNALKAEASMREDQASKVGPWTVICDFDGTIADVDVTDELLARFALPAWTEIEADWKAGLITSRDCMERQVKLLRFTRPELERFLEGISIDAGFRDFIAECRWRQLPVRVVSDGIEEVIRSILRRHNLGQLPVTANQLVATGGSTYELRFPNANAQCTAASGTCKCARAMQEPRSSRVLLIGDGRSDFCLASAADFVFSKSKLTQHCEEQGIAHRSFDRFADIHYLLSELLDHPHHHMHRKPLSWSLER